MISKKLSLNKVCIILATTILLLSVVMFSVLYILTKEMSVVFCSMAFCLLFLLCVTAFVILIRRKLTLFSEILCCTLDEMMNGKIDISQVAEEENLFYKINHRLVRLYEVMQESKNSVASERADLQELISDISHQVKTPISNLKMINATLLEQEVPQDKQREFLLASGTQLDKLDFLMQAMIKTSRLETGVISLEKKQQPIYDTLAMALGGIFLNAERKHIQVEVNCPETLVVSHDRKWTAEALFNILDNAVKYTPEYGSIRVCVESWEMQLPTYWFAPVRALNSVVLPQFGFPASAIVIAITLFTSLSYINQAILHIRFYLTSTHCASAFLTVSSYPRTVISTGSPSGATFLIKSSLPFVIPISIIRRL